MYASKNNKSSTRHARPPLLACFFVLKRTLRFAGSSCHIHGLGLPVREALQGCHAQLELLNCPAHSRDGEEASWQKPNFSEKRKFLLFFFEIIESRGDPVGLLSYGKLYLVSALTVLLGQICANRLAFQPIDRVLILHTSASV